jgi:tetratricopeptide (TPR) repeat protein
MRALLYLNLKRFDEALADSRRSVQLDQGNADAHNDLAAVLQKLGRCEESLEWHDRAIALRPDLILALNGKAGSLTELRRIDEAFAWYARALALDSEDANARWNLAAPDARRRF